jgi:hypothetical protein
MHCVLRIVIAIALRLRICTCKISREITQAGKRAFWWFGGV